MWPLLGAGLVLGLMKYNEDQKNAASQRQLAAKTDQYSPWTGMHGQQVKNPSLIGDVGQTALTGAMLGQGMDSAAGANKLQAAQTGYFDAAANKLNGAGGVAAAATPGMNPYTIPGVDDPSSPWLQQRSSSMYQWQ